jgi:RHS repeat-associated protein
MSPGLPGPNHQEVEESTGLGGGFETNGSIGSHWVNYEVVRYYIWSGDQVICELDNPNSVSQINVYALGKQLARREIIGQSEIQHLMISDRQGTVRSDILFSGSGGMALAEYYPYGGVAPTYGNNSTRREFIGKEVDNVKESDFGPRYYDNTLCRFLAPDPILASMSAYSYSEGNPISRSDPSGLKSVGGGRIVGLPQYETPEERARYYSNMDRQLADMEAQIKYEMNTVGMGYTATDAQGNDAYTVAPEAVAEQRAEAFDANKAITDEISKAKKEGRQPNITVVVGIYHSDASPGGHAAMAVFVNNVQVAYVSFAPPHGLESFEYAYKGLGINRNMQFDLDEYESATMDWSGFAAALNIYMSDPAQIYYAGHQCVDAICEILAGGGYNGPQPVPPIRDPYGWEATLYTGFNSWGWNKELDR